MPLRYICVQLPRTPTHNYTYYQQCTKYLLLLFYFITKKKKDAERELLLGKIVKDGNEQTILSNVSLGIEHFLSRKDSNPKGCLSVN